VKMEAALGLLRDMKVRFGHVRGCTSVEEPVSQTSSFPSIMISSATGLRAQLLFSAAIGHLLRVARRRRGLHQAVGGDF
jgi:hypothetical protein